MPKAAYKSTVFAVPNCGRFCRNVCTRLFIVGRNQCIADCLRCAGLRGTSKSNVKSIAQKVHKPKRQCNCGCGKCK